MAEVRNQIFCTAVAPYIESHYPEQHKRTQKLMAAHRQEIADLYQNFRNYKSDKTIRLWDAQNKAKLPGELVTSNIRPKLKDKTYTEVYDRADIVYRFLDDIFDLKSVDGKNMALQFVVHYKKKYGNAFWNGRFLVIGDGDDQLKNFCRSLTVIAHEMGHAVQEKAGCNWNYDKRTGPLNEHWSDFLGVIVEQFENSKSKDPKVKARARPDKAAWDVGDEVIDDLPRLRTFKEERAYENVEGLGTDPQPWNMSMLVSIHDPKDPDDNVHKYSKIFNNVFRKFAVYLFEATGKFAYEDPAQIWFECLKRGKSNDSFYEFRDNLKGYVKDKYGEGSIHYTCLLKALVEVELEGHQIVRYWE
ncbi:MAG: M4 family metallopeptidase [Parachlamydiaceae bacterium]